MNTGKVLSVELACLLPFSVLYASDSPGVSRSGPPLGTREKRLSASFHKYGNGPVRDSPGRGAQRGVPRSGLWSESGESPRSGAYDKRAEPAASGREVASEADAEAPREHLAPGALCGYVAVIMEWTTKDAHERKVIILRGVFPVTTIRPKPLFHPLKGRGLHGVFSLYGLQ
jgi:hypothetical protein